MKLDFRDWLLSEVGTGTNSVAVFARPIFGDAIRRTWPPFTTVEDEEKKKKRAEDEEK
jgi:hypothetical protein